MARTEGQHLTMGFVAADARPLKHTACFFCEMPIGVDDAPECFCVKCDLHICRRCDPNRRGDHTGGIEYHGETST